MKSLPLLVFLFVLFAKTSVAQCTPLARSGKPGLSPSPVSFPCIKRGEPFDAMIQFEGFDTVGGIIFLHTTIDSISGGPNGISFNILPDNQFTHGETGCIQVSGVTNDSIGSYFLRVYISLVTGGSLEALTGDFYEVMDNLFLLGIIENRINRYYLCIVNPDDTCPTDTLCQKNTGIENMQSASFAYPNPASSSFNIILSRHLADFDLQVMDISGRVVKTLNSLSGDRINLDLKDFQSGIFFYQIISNNSLVSRGKLVVIKE